MFQSAPVTDSAAQYRLLKTARSRRPPSRKLPAGSLQLQFTSGSEPLSKRIERRFRIRLRESDDAPDRALEIASLLIVNAIEQIEVTRINTPSQERRVIQRNALSIQRIDGLELWRDLVDERDTSAGIYSIARTNASLPVSWVCGVRRIERLDHSRPESRQQLVVLPLRFHFRRGCFLTARPEECCGSARANEHGKRFIERCLTRCVESVVGELVNHGVRETNRVAFERGVEQRIVEKSERAECVGRPDIDIQPIVREISRFTPGSIEIEIAFIRHSSDDRKPPRVGLEGVAIGGRDDENQGVVIQS